MAAFPGAEIVDVRQAPTPEAEAVPPAEDDDVED
jgi:hypothetical protein